MPNLRFVKSAVAVALCATAAYVAGLRHAASIETKGSHPTEAVTQSEDATLAVNRPTESAPTRTEAEHEALAQVVALRRALLAQAMRPPLVAPVQSPVALACQKLDERLSNSPPNAAESARMEQAIRSVTNSGILAGADATISCGATICKVDLIDSDNARVDTAADALSRGVSKTFASTVIYPQGEGVRAIYFASNSESLRLSPLPEEPVVIAKRTTEANE